MNLNVKIAIIILSLKKDIVFIVMMVMFWKINALNAMIKMEVEWKDAKVVIIIIIELLVFIVKKVIFY
jgi:hypothetical protein